MSIGIRIIILILGLALSSNILASDLQPFTTDGCSNFPEGPPSDRNLWLSCCTSHDVAYWKGGTRAERVEADAELRECVKRVGEPNVALLMLIGVKIGGSPYFPTSFRWAYGWPYPRGYAPLTPSEERAVQQQLQVFND